MPCSSRARRSRYGSTAGQTAAQRKIPHCFFIASGSWTVYTGLCCCCQCGCCQCHHQAVAPLTVTPWTSIDSDAAEKTIQAYFDTYCKRLRCLPPRPPNWCHFILGEKLTGHVTLVGCKFAIDRVSACSSKWAAPFKLTTT